jgi:type IV secretory pathway VirB10-like protein
MSGDKLKRVKAVKKWLDKAENAYSGHRELTGEMNLMMAQAEMQRLKEVHKHSSIQKWGLRGCAMIVAVLLFFGFHFLQREMNKTEIESVPSVEIVIHDAPPAKIVSEEAAPPVTEKTEEVHAALPAETPEVKPAPTPAPVTASAPPALSEQEIQSVVGEAGRALRGQV